MKSNNTDTETFKTELNLINEIYSNDTFRMPIRYILGLTNDCNLDCSFCFLEKHKGEFTMNLKDWKRVVDQLPAYARVIMFGGEPLVYRDFDEIYKYVASKLKCTIVTNGTLLTPKKINTLLSQDGLEEIAVSIDCIGNTNRGFENRQWEKLVSGIKLYNEKRKKLSQPPKLAISAVILDETAHGLFDMHRYAHEELNCDYITYCTLNGTSMQLCDKMEPFISLHSPEQPPLYENWDLIQSELNKIRLYNKKNSINSYFRPKIIDLNQDEPILKLSSLNRTEFKKEEFGACKIPWSDCRIYSDGSVSSCLGVSLGNIKSNNSLTSILEGEMSSLFRQQLKNHGFFEKCSRCVFLYNKKFS